MLNLELGTPDLYNKDLKSLFRLVLLYKSLGSLIYIYKSLATVF